MFPQFATLASIIEVVNCTGLFCIPNWIIFLSLFLDVELCCLSCSYYFFMFANMASVCLSNSFDAKRQRHFDSFLVSKNLGEKNLCHLSLDQLTNMIWFLLFYWNNWCDLLWLCWYVAITVMLPYINVDLNYPNFNRRRWVNYSIKPFILAFRISDVSLDKFSPITSFKKLLFLYLWIIALCFLYSLLICPFLSRLPSI